MSEETTNEEEVEERVMRDLQRRPKSRRHREIVLISGERVKRTDIGWSEEDASE